MPPEIYAVLGKLISTLEMNYRKNPFLLKSLSLINSSSFSFPKYWGECPWPLKCSIKTCGKRGINVLSLSVFLSWLQWVFDNLFPGFQHRVLGNHLKQALSPLKQVVSNAALATSLTHPPIHSSFSPLTSNPAGFQSWTLKPSISSHTGPHVSHVLNQVTSSTSPTYFLHSENCMQDNQVARLALQFASIKAYALFGKCIFSVEYKEKRVVSSPMLNTFNP